MKNMLQFLMPIVLVNALGIFAVTWQKESDPFSFPTTGSGPVMPELRARVNFHCVSFNNGVVTMKYQLPSGIEHGTLKIFGLCGNLIASIKVNSSSSSVQWNAKKNNVTSGVYMAALQYGVKEERIKLSIVR